MNYNEKIKKIIDEYNLDKDDNYYFNYSYDDEMYTLNSFEINFKNNSIDDIKKILNNIKLDLINLDNSRVITFEIGKISNDNKLKKYKSYSDGRIIKSNRNTNKEINYIPIYKSSTHIKQANLQLSNLYNIFTNLFNLLENKNIKKYQIKEKNMKKIAMGFEDVLKDNIDKKSEDILDIDDLSSQDYQNGVHYLSYTLNGNQKVHKKFCIGDNGIFNKLNQENAQNVFYSLWCDMVQNQDYKSIEWKFSSMVRCGECYKELVYYKLDMKKNILKYLDNFRDIIMDIVKNKEKVLK